MKSNNKNNNNNKGAAKPEEKYVKTMSVKIFNLEAGIPVAVVHEKDGEELGLRPLDRIEIANPKTNSRTVAILDFTVSMVEVGEIGLMLDLSQELKIRKDKEKVQVKAMYLPESLQFIKKKLRKEVLSEEELKVIVNDVTFNRLSDIELSSFMTAVYIHGFNLEETVAMTKSLIENGKIIDIGKKPILDKHCIGGINGRATMLVVPIVAAEGFYIPKTSSRSITSAAGTADAMEVLCPVTLDVNEIKRITEKVGAVICWGGAVELAPADDKIIKIEHPLALDPPGQIVASVMAKKGSVGAQFVVIDMPVGPDTKIKTKEAAKEMAVKFIEVGKKLGMKVEVVITDGTEPSGKAFGPALEAKHVMEILEGKVFDNLAQKACELAGVLFELVGRVEAGKGFKLAKEVLRSGKALKKMQEIIAAQGGTVKSSGDIELSDLKKSVVAQEEGNINRINVRKLANIARAAGAPADKKAGLCLNVEEGGKVKKGDVIYEIYAENARKLEVATKIALKDRAIEWEKIILEKFV